MLRVRAAELCRVCHRRPREVVPFRNVGSYREMKEGELRWFGGRSGWDERGSAGWGRCVFGWKERVPSLPLIFRTVINFQSVCLGFRTTHVIISALRYMGYTFIQVFGLLFLLFFIFLVFFSPSVLILSMFFHRLSIVSSRAGYWFKFQE